MKAVSDLRKHIGYWMRLVSNNVSHSFARKLQGVDVTVAEWVLLRELYGLKAPVAPSFLSDVTGLTRGAISKLVDRLMRKELIACESSQDDRRFQAIQLTAAARRLVPKLARLADENDEYFFSGLTRDERKTLLILLMKVAESRELKKPPVE